MRSHVTKPTIPIVYIGVFVPLRYYSHSPVFTRKNVCIYILSIHHNQMRKFQKVDCTEPSVYI